MKTIGKQECKGGSEYIVYVCKIVKNKQKHWEKSSNLFEKVCYEQKQKEGTLCSKQDSQIPVLWWLFEQMDKEQNVTP